MKMIRRLILSGGGCSAIAYLGVLKYLEANGYKENIKYVAGTSMGAFFALIWALDIPINDFIEVTLEFFKTKKIFPYQYDFEKFGMDDAHNFEDLIVNYLPNKKITFTELYSETNINLVIVATCVNTQEPVYFSYENTPDICIIDALKASVAVPFFTHAINIKDQLYIDGGISDNIPIFAWGKDTFYTHKNEYYIARINGYKFMNIVPTNLLEYAITLIEIAIRNHNPYETFIDEDRVLVLDACPLSFLPIEFNETGIELLITPELINESIAYGDFAARSRASAVRSPVYSES